MQDIIYRGKRVDTGEWVEGDLMNKYWDTINKFGVCIDNDRNFINTGTLLNTGTPLVYKVTPETVGQCTGLKDKNEKKIFEGDIVVDGRGHYGKVFFENDCFLIEWTIKDYIKGKSVDDSFGCAEVVGNIYDNPELLAVE